MKVPSNSEFYNIPGEYERMVKEEKEIVLKHENEHVTITLERYENMLEEYEETCKEYEKLEEELELYKHNFLEPLIKSCITVEGFLVDATASPEQILDQLVSCLKYGNMKIERCEDPLASEKNHILWKLSYDPKDVIQHAGSNWK